MNAGVHAGLIAELRIPASTDRLKLLRCVIDQATTLAGCDTELRERLVLALNEACMNIIQHAYRHDPQGEIILEIINNGDALVFRLTDFAAPVDPALLTARDLNEIRPGGLGLHLINAVMDDVRYLVPASGTGNVLQLTKSLR